MCGLNSNGPDLPNYQAHVAGDVVGHMAVRVHTYILRLFGVGNLYSVESFLVIVYSLLGAKICINSRYSLLSITLFTIFFLFSYESVSLYGNILRQGTASFLVLLVYPFNKDEGISVIRSFVLFLACFIHLSALPLIVWLLVLSDRLTIKIKFFPSKHFLVSLAILVTALYLASDYFVSRLEVLVHNREFFTDIWGYLYAFFCFFLSLVLVQFSGKSHKWTVICLFLIFLCTVMFGEFGQRVLISLSFGSLVYVLGSRRVGFQMVLLIFFSIIISSSVMFYKNSYFFEILN